ncbi:MAG: apolipoprotein N-acyltransferase [Bacteroidia bacterium]|nr:apolipoprotein N-acyltransferase [Bacteroidia bacterium]
MAIIYALVSGLLMVLAWPVQGWAPLIFMAWVPLLLIEERILNDGNHYNNLRVFGLAYLSFLTWNVGTTWWVLYASLGGALLANLANTLLMASVFMLFHILRKRIPAKQSMYYLPIVWLAFEYFHFDWDLSWPWLTLGNVFAEDYQLIQWYEFTGTSGGTLWVLLINIAITRLLLSVNKANQVSDILKKARLIIAGMLLPILTSLLIYYNTSDKGEKVNVAVVQPNVDPYLEKFDERTFDHQLSRFIRLASAAITDSTDWLFGPETALAGSIDEAELSGDDRIKRLDSLLSAHPGLNILMGAETHRFYRPGQEHPTTARQLQNRDDVFYDVYNTALFMNKGKKQVYHKSKLVPGVEQMPFPAIFRFVEKWAINMGGTTGTLGTQKERTVFEGIKPSQLAAPAICYESVYGDFMQKYIANGASFIAVITNDGWWDDTPGYRQHLAYARLRAIENRRSIVRSANTGISCLINQRGDISHASQWWTASSFNGTIKANTGRTFFSVTGDFLGLAATWMSLWLLAWMVWLRFRKNTSSTPVPKGKPESE